MGDAPFWETTRLEAMSDAQWESLCDGCARCCLLKVTDVETERVRTLRVACRLLDVGACRCADYLNRHERVPHCHPITPDSARSFSWLPETCAYRRLAHGLPLPEWHPLITGAPESVHEAGVSVRGVALSERHIDEALFPMLLLD